MEPPAQRDCAANFASEFTAQPAPEEHVEVGGWWGYLYGSIPDSTNYLKHFYSCREKKLWTDKNRKKKHRFQKVMFWFVFLGTL